MDVRDLSDKTVLITGAAAGIGLATARACAQRGARLVLCDVNGDALNNARDSLTNLGANVFARRADVGSRDEMRAFAGEVHDSFEAVDLLINNAGVGLGGNFLDTSLDDWEWIVHTNLFGVLHGCHFFLPPMVRRGRGGHVVNVASAAAYAPLPAQSAYAAVKFAVLGLSETLRAELATSRIGVTAACPGFIDTGIVETARLRGVIATAGYRERTRAFYRRRNYSPDRVARNLLRAVQRNRAVAPISPEAWLMFYLTRFAPGLFRRGIRRLASRLGRMEEDI